MWLPYPRVCTTQAGPKRTRDRQAKKSSLGGSRPAADGGRLVVSRRRPPRTSQRTCHKRLDRAPGGRGAGRRPSGGRGRPRSDRDRDARRRIARSPPRRHSRSGHRSILARASIRSDRAGRGSISLVHQLDRRPEKHLFSRIRAQSRRPLGGPRRNRPSPAGTGSGIGHR